MSRTLTNVSNLRVLYEDNHLIIINKRVGDLVQGDKTHNKPLSEITKEYLKIKYRKKGNVFLGVAHRLDRPTSGALIFCKTSKALKRVNNMFQNKEIQKFYWAIVRNKPKQRKDTLTHWLKKNPSTNTTKVYKKEIINSKKAILHYNLIKSLKSYYLLEISLETGRSHQIRTQLSFIGSPIKGDLKYGAKRSNSNGGIHLHAKKIKFIHPISKKIISIEADLPDDIIWKNCK